MRTDVRDSVASIAGVQERGGAIPWVPGGILDPWDHVEAAMGLDAGGHNEGAERAYLWLAHMQREDGAWFAAYRNGIPDNHTLDANFVAYVAAGVWHHYLTTDSVGFLHRMWPTVERALDFCVELQLPDGSIAWARDTHYRPWPGALLTSSSCIHLSLRCGIAIAERLGGHRPDWELALLSLEEAIAIESPSFEDKSLFAMDWYYPIIGGVLRGDLARQRLAARWDEFVVEGLGCRCVSDRPWVTSGETAELILALVVAGMTDTARDILGWIRHLRHDDGSYWTGATFPEGIRWPHQRPTWCAGAVVLAAAALAGDGATFELFRSPRRSGAATEGYLPRVLP